MGMPSSTFFSELTDGLTRFCSINEIMPFVTPARFASSRCDSPYIVRTVFKCVPTSMFMPDLPGATFRIIDGRDKNVSEQRFPLPRSVHFSYHPATSIRQFGTPTMTASSERSGLEPPTMPAALDRNDLEAFWMPFTANRQFKANPRLLARAEGMYYWTADGRKVLDGAAGLWCVNAGHCRKEITAAVSEQIGTMEFAPTFQMGHPLAFEFANRLAKLAPGDLNHVFFVNSGSEAVDTALKIAIAYHRVRGEGARTRLIGRERGYHGVGFGGIAVGGIVHNQKMFGSLLAGVDHIRH